MPIVHKEICLLHPDLQPLCNSFLMRCKVSGIDARVTETWRSPKRQIELYASGRTTPGPILTRALPDLCKHCFVMDEKPASKAFDFLIWDVAGKIIEDGKDPHYTKAGLIGEGVGLTWGGRFGRPDEDHFEIL